MFFKIVHIRRRLGTMACILCAGAMAVSNAVAADLPDALPDEPWLLPLKFETSSNPAQQQFNYFDFMWRSFIAINWPNVPITTATVGNRRVITNGFRGQPDTSQSILNQKGSGPLALTVWETYREPSEIFLPPEQWPNYPDWNTPRPVPNTIYVPQGARPLKRQPDGLTAYATDINQPFFFPDPTGPLIDQNGNYVRYEVAVNQAYFTYVRHFEYFNADRQVTDVMRSVVNPNDPNGFQRPPFGFESEFANGGYLSGLPPSRGKDWSM